MNLTWEMLDEVLALDKETNKLYWKPRQKASHNFNQRFAGKEVALTVRKDGYLNCWVLGKCLLVHRVIYMLANKVSSPSELDHINGDRTDNRPENLVEVTRSGNMRKAVRTNKKGLPRGVTQIPSGSYSAKFKGKRLGCFKTVEEAVTVYQQVSEDYYRGHQI